LKEREYVLEEQLKGLNYSEDTLSKLPYYEKTKDGSDLLKSFATELKNNSGVLSEGNLSIEDIINTTSQYNDILQDRIKEKNKSIQTAQEIDMYMDTKAPQWYHEARDKNRNADWTALRQYKANLTVDKGEYENLRKSLDKKDTIFEGLSNNDHMWNKIVQQVELVQDGDVARLAAINSLYSGIQSDQDAEWKREIGYLEEEKSAIGTSIAHKTTSIALMIPHMKYEDTENALESMVTFQDEVFKMVNNVHAKHGVHTAFGRDLLQSAAEIANAKVSSEAEQVRVIQVASSYISQAFTELDISSAADRDIASGVFELMKSSGILSTFTTEDEFIDMGGLNDTITHLMGELNLLNETQIQMYSDRRTGGNLPDFTTSSKDGKKVKGGDKSSLNNVETDDKVVDNVITESIDSLYQNFEAPPLIESFAGSFDSKIPIEEPEIVEEDRDMPSFQGVQMPSFLHEWEFVGFKEPMMIGNNEFNSAPLLFRNKESGETTSNPEWIGQQELNYEEIGEYRDYKNKLTAIYEAQSSLRRMQSEVTNLKEKRARLNKNVVNKNSKYYTDKNSFYEEEIKRLSQIIVNNK
jgi:hypothetical protein